MWIETQARLQADLGRATHEPNIGTRAEVEQASHVSLLQRRSPQSEAGSQGPVPMGQQFAHTLHCDFPELAPPQQQLLLETSRSDRIRGLDYGAVKRLVYRTHSGLMGVLWTN